MDLDTIDKLNEQLFRLKCGTGVLFLLHECMRRGSFSSEILAPTAYAAYDYLSSAIYNIREIYGGSNDS